MNLPKYQKKARKKALKSNISNINYFRPDGALLYRHYNHKGDKGLNKMSIRSIPFLILLLIRQEKGEGVGGKGVRCI